MKIEIQNSNGEIVYKKTISLDKNLEKPLIESLIITVKQRIKSIENTNKIIRQKMKEAKIC